MGSRLAPQTNAEHLLDSQPAADTPQREVRGLVGRGRVDGGRRLDPGDQGAVTWRVGAYADA